MTRDAPASSAGAEQETPVRIPTSRMLVAVVALAGAMISGYMLLYKLGVITSLACGTGACESVQASPWSDFLGVPVPLWGVVGYGLIFVTALIGIQPAYATDRRIAILLVAACTYAFAFSLYLTWIEAVRIRAWCRWCVGSAIVATLLFLLALPELNRIRRGQA
jgi:uncharacterized membrane protein